MITDTASPFHQGEQQLQQGLGVREQMEHFGRRVIRSFMPAQHRDFYQQLPYVFAGFSDEQGQPWASILFAQSGFIRSPDERSLVIKPDLLEFDPLKDYLERGGESSDIALLGVELETRRRNRLSAVLESYHKQALTLSIKQSFGNCPQYIQARLLQDQIKANKNAVAREVHRFDQASKDLIARSDTFFVASSLPATKLSQGQAAAAGADISHRGGRPGFVRIDGDDTLTIPDYAGNNHFNTLGNLIENPVAGLLFIDFASGDVLTLTGSAEVVLVSDEIEHFRGAERLWRFRLQRGYYAQAALQASWSLESWSANTQLTGTWSEAREQEKLAQQKNRFESFDIAGVEEENTSIKSFYLKPQSGALRQFKPGQFLTFSALIDGKQQQRCYSLSSAPSDDYYRISVKRDGVFSNFLHGLSAGEKLQVQAPSGDFYYDLNSTRPALMLAAGVGITPFVAMLREAVSHAVAKRYWRPALLIVSVKDLSDLSFVDELNQIEQLSQGRLQIVYCFTRLATKPSAVELEALGLRAENCFNRRLDQSLLAQIMAGANMLQQLGEVEAHLCGPDAFMQAQYDALLDLGLSDDAILAEAFGPASIKRQIVEVETAEAALVAYADSQGRELMALNWQNQDGSLLNFALQHGLEPNYSCQQGFCGSCRCKKIDGEVVYTKPLSESLLAGLEQDDVILCCAAPAPGSDSLQLAFID